MTIREGPQGSAPGREVPRPTGQIGMVGDVEPPGRVGEDRKRCDALHVGVLGDQQATGTQQSGGIALEHAKGVEPVFAGPERGRGVVWYRR